MEHPEDVVWRIDMQVRAKILKHDVADAQMKVLNESMVEYLEKLEKAKVLENADMSFVGIALDKETNDELDNEEGVLYNKACVDEADELLEVQKLTVETDQFKYNDYMRGMYNGMELIVSTMEGRLPMFLDEFGRFSKKEGNVKIDDES